MSITSESITKWKELNTTFREVHDPIVEKVTSIIDMMTRAWVSNVKVNDIDDEHVRAEYDASYSCGDNDYDLLVHIPIEWLFKSNEEVGALIRAEEATKLAAAQAAKEAKELEEKRAREKAKEEARLRKEAMEADPEYQKYLDFRKRHNIGVIPT